jgi:nucleoside 2-deoxyribosyltransferase
MRGFFAYPESSPMVTQAILEVVEKSKGTEFQLEPWQRMRIIGFKVDDVVRTEIDKAAVVVADITYPNPNVLYEIGYAIARGKPVLPTVNVAIEKAVQHVQRVGLFDNIGWATYENADELYSHLQSWPDYAWSNGYVQQRDYSQPLYILDTLVKTDFRNHIFQAVENSGVKYRSFDPSQIPRLTASQAISDISASAGVIIPILGDDIVDAKMNNLRAGFMLGLCHGFDVHAMAIQYGNGPAPLDYRDFITNSTFRRETENHVGRFCAEVLIWNQKVSLKGTGNNLGLISEIDLGSAMAENETLRLSEYFVQTAEYSRAMRADGAVVIGRKGSGKSAIQIQIVENLSRDRRRCIVDLRPASHNLSEMREELLSVVSAGIFDHTIAAFWQYTMYMEILLKLREAIIPQARNDFRLQERIRALEEQFGLDDSIVAGDFTSRLRSAVNGVIRAVKDNGNSTDFRSQITNLMFEAPIPKLRDAIVSLSDVASELVVLIDDLDKGWPPRQVEQHDISMVKHLIEVLNRIQRDLGKKGANLRHLIFLRSDVYERLVEETSDRGKYNVIKIDWTDPEQLKYLISQRIKYRIDEKDRKAAWELFDTQLHSGQRVIDRLIAHSLYRPRFLIDLCERTLSVAVNRGHHQVEEQDVEEGLRQMSLYLVSDFGYEMRDIAGTPEDIFYSFIDKSDLLTEGEILDILKRDDLKIDAGEVIELLMWYGFLGVVDVNGTPVFIYDLAYDSRRLEAERNRVGGERLYPVNPGFLLGLTRKVQHATPPDVAPIAPAT